MAQINQVQTQGYGAQPGFLTPMDPYSGLYGQPEGYAQSINDYYNSQDKSYDIERANLIESNKDKVRSIFGNDDRNAFNLAEKFGFITYDSNGLPSFNPNGDRAGLDAYANSGDFGAREVSDLVYRMPERIEKARKEYWTSDADIIRNSASLQNLNQRQASSKAERLQATTQPTGFRQEMDRFTKNMVAPNLMAAYVAPGLQQAGQNALAYSNAAGGGALGQAAARRSAFGQFGSAAAGVVPQAVAKQGELDTMMKQQYEKQRAGMIQSNFQNQMTSSSQRYNQNMQQQMYQKALEEYQHDRDMEKFKATMDVVGSFSKASLGAAGIAAGGGNNSAPAP